MKKKTIYNEVKSNLMHHCIKRTGNVPDSSFFITKKALKTTWQIPGYSDTTYDIINSNFGISPSNNSIIPDKLSILKREDLFFQNNGVWIISPETPISSFTDLMRSSNIFTEKRPSYSAQGQNLEYELHKKGLTTIIPNKILTNPVILNFGEDIYRREFDIKRYNTKGNNNAKYIKNFSKLLATKLMLPTISSPPLFIALGDGGSELDMIEQHVIENIKTEISIERLLKEKYSDRPPEEVAGELMRRVKAYYINSRITEQDERQGFTKIAVLDGNKFGTRKKPDFQNDNFEAKKITEGSYIVAVNCKNIPIEEDILGLGKDVECMKAFGDSIVGDNSEFEW